MALVCCSFASQSSAKGPKLAQSQRKSSAWRQETGRRAQAWTGLANCPAGPSRMSIKLLAIARAIERDAASQIDKWHRRSLGESIYSSVFARRRRVPACERQRAPRLGALALVSRTFAACNHREVAGQSGPRSSAARQPQVAVPRWTSRAPTVLPLKRRQCLC